MLFRHITIGFITTGSSGWPGKTWVQETWMGSDKYQQLPHKAPMLQRNDQTTGNTENRADHSSLFEIFVHHYLISSACFQDFEIFVHHYLISSACFQNLIFSFTRLHLSCVLWQE